MTVNEIKKAVDNDKVVKWCNDNYTVIALKSNYLIMYKSGSLIGLTWKDGKTLNGKESEFYIKEKS